ncbi:MAG: hypothetical protein KIS83_10905 [Rubrivivax sp.]|nr:hypothetical protein [Rubrivivax sp.]
MRLADIARLLQHPTLRGTVAVQSLGSVATLVTTFLIAWMLGPLAQGHYAWLRASADLLLALALLGLPQGIVHLLGRHRTRPEAAWRIVMRCVAPLAAAGLALAVAIDAGWLALPWQGPGGPPVTAWLFAVGVLGWVLHALQRAFLLCLSSTATFSWLTTAPALILLAAVALQARAGSSAWEWALAASGLASAGLGAVLLGRATRQPAWRQGEAASGTELLRASGHAFWHVVAMSLQGWIALMLLQMLGGGARELGWFTLALQVQLLWVLPAAYVVPLIHARVSAAAGDGTRAPALGQPLAAAGVVASLAAAVVAAMLPWVLPATLGERYEGAVAASVCMALGGPAAMLGRLGGALLLGAGRLVAASALHALRLGLLLAGVALWALWTARAPGGGLASMVTAVALAWTVAEAVAAAVTFALRPELTGRGGVAAATAAP